MYKITFYYNWVFNLHYLKYFEYVILRINEGVDYICVITIQMNADVFLKF